MNKNYTTSPNNPRYSRDEYPDFVGAVGEELVQDAIEDIILEYELPWKLDYHHVNNSGPDITIRNIDTDNVVAKLEVINFAPESYMSKTRALSIRENLKGVSNKGLISSFSSNIRYEAEEILKGIPVCFLQSQFLPKIYHDEIPGHLRHRKLESERSVKWIKKALLGLFRRIGLLPVVYVYHRSSVRSVSRILSRVLTSCVLWDKLLIEKVKKEGSNWLSKLKISKYLLPNTTSSIFHCTILNDPHCSYTLFKKWRCEYYVQ